MPNRTRTNEAVWNEKERRWYIQIMKKGVRRRFYSSVPGRKGKIEAERKADEWLRSELKDGSIKISALFDLYIKDMEANDLYTKQYTGYGRRYILPDIGKKRIDDLCEQDLQNILTKQYRRGLSKHTLQNVRGCLSSFLRFCRASNYTKLHPELLRVNKNAKSGSRRALQPNELRILFSSEETLMYGKPVRDWYIYAYRFLVATGLRPGELCGIRWQDVSDDYTVTVCESYNNDLQMTTGKNENARRTFKLNAEAIRALDAQKRALMENGIISQWVFPRQLDGEISTQQKILRAFHKYCEHNGIAHTTLYELRHTYISVNKEMPTELLKAQVGHSAAMDTYSVYSHELQGERERAAEYSTFAFQNIINAKKGDTKTDTISTFSPFS